MVDDRKSQKSQLEEMRHGSLQWMGIGIEFVVVVCVCSWAGNWLDKKGDTSPGFMVLFFLFGFVSMIYTMIKRAGGLKWKGDGGNSGGGDVGSSSNSDNDGGGIGSNNNNNNGGDDDDWQQR